MLFRCTVRFTRGVPEGLLNRRNVGALTVAVATAALGWFLLKFTFGSGLVNLSYDLLHILRVHNLPANEAVIIYLDEKSHLDLNQPLNAPWDRALHARMLDRLTA